MGELNFLWWLPAIGGVAVVALTLAFWRRVEGRGSRLPSILFGTTMALHAWAELSHCDREVLLVTGGLWIASVLIMLPSVLRRDRELVAKIRREREQVAGMPTDSAP